MGLLSISLFFSPFCLSLTLLHQPGRNQDRTGQPLTHSNMAMDNKTVRDAIAIRGTDPQFLIEKILRTRIYECSYWKEQCFGLTGMTPLPCLSPSPSP